uniref:Hedgehog/Intein (Hint) domain-containing protein n=1 Tax=viral metagenome TaxID=1070528 RepID=A0A6C0D9K1_9ZZZZ
MPAAPIITAASTDSNDNGYLEWNSDETVASYTIWITDICDGSNSGSFPAPPGNAVNLSNLPDGHILIVWLTATGIDGSTSDPSQKVLLIPTRPTTVISRDELDVALLSGAVGIYEVSNVTGIYQSDTSVQITAVACAEGSTTIIDTSLLPSNDELYIPINNGTIILQTPGNNTYTFTFSLVNGSEVVTLSVNGGPQQRLGINTTFMVDRITYIVNSIFPFIPIKVPLLLPCFMGDAPVLTPSGYRRMDSLSVEDKVLTPCGRVVEIKYISKTRVQPGDSANPYIIEKGMFKANKRLLISPHHAVFIPSRGMVEAYRLGLKQMKMKKEFFYYNLELPNWENMIVAGVEVESLAPKKRIICSTAEFEAFVNSLSPVVRANINIIAKQLPENRTEACIIRKRTNT